MAKNGLSKAFNGFVVYESNGEYPIDIQKIPTVENFDYLKYEIAAEDEVSSIGFEPVIEMEVTTDGELVREEEYVHSVGTFDVIKIKQSKRKVPGSEVKKIVSEKTRKAIAEAEERGQTIKVNKELKEMFKEEAIKELLPRCFIDESSTFVFLDKVTEKLYVAVPSHKKAEDITAFIRKTLGSLPITPLVTEREIVKAMTQFVTSQLNDKITLGDFVQMEDEEGVVAWKKESLYNSDAKELIENSEKLVTKLGLNFDGVVSFTIDSDYVISGVKFESYVTAEGHDFSSTFLLIANEITGAVKELLKELGEE
jgi:recombination associated protein RdgC